jgi:hypothetical protein
VIVGRTGGARVVRPWRALWLGGNLFVGASLVVAGVALPVAGIPNGWWEWSLALTYLVVGVATLVASLRVRIELASENVTMVNPIRSEVWAWSDVCRVDEQVSALLINPAPVIHLHFHHRDGRTFRPMGTAWLREQARAELAETIRQHLPVGAEATLDRWLSTPIAHRKRA